MPLVIYLGLHAIMREPASILPPEQRQATLAALSVKAPAAALDQEEHSPAEAAEGQLDPVLLLDTWSEEVTNTISQWLRQNTANHVTLVWLQPVPYIAARLAQEADAESALLEWQYMANGILSFFRQHRRQVTLVGAEPKVEPPHREGIALLTLPAVEHAPIYTLAATQLLASNTGLQEIASHLLASSACTYPQVGSEHSNVLTALDYHWQTVQLLHTNEQQLSDLKEQCSKAENQLAQLHAEKQASEAQFNKQHQEHQAASKEQAALQKQLMSTKEENDQIIAELHKVQETLETTLHERDAAHKQAAELKKAQTALEQVQKEKAALETRLSTATTAHQQAKKAAEDAKQQAQKSSQQQQAEHNKALVSVQEENDLIIAELHKVQETLETTLHERDAARKQANELKKAQTTFEEQVKKDKTALQAQLTTEQATVQKVQKQHQEALQQVNKLQQALTSTKEENELVIAELHRLQELLESKLIERESLVEQHSIVIQQRDSALQQLDQRLAQLQKLHSELKKCQAEQTTLYSRIERYQKQLNMQKSDFQQVLQEQEIWLQWLRAHATRYITATYRHSRDYRKALSQQIALLEVSQHFDKQWYLEQNPDIANSNMDPAEHYIKFGALEGRNPSPNFDTDFYITQNHDVAEAGHHPLLHFLRHGQLEQRLTTYEQRQLPSPSSAVSGVSHE